MNSISKTLKNEFVITALMSLMTLSAMANENPFDKAAQFKSSRETTSLENFRNVQKAVSEIPGRKVVSFTNDISTLFSLASHNPEMLKKMARATSIKVNGVAIPLEEQRAIPIFNNRYTLSFSTLPGFISTINEMTESSVAYLKAALIKVVTMPANPFKFEFTYECEHDGEQEQYISNSLVEQKHFVELLEQPKGLWSTLWEFAQNKICWTDWLSIQFHLPRTGQSS